RDDEVAGFVPVAIQRPEATRIRNNGLLQTTGTLILNESLASPTGLRAAAGVSMAASVVPAGLPALPAKVPITLATGPLIPLKFEPLRPVPRVEGAVA